MVKVVVQMKVLCSSYISEGTGVVEGGSTDMTRDRGGKWGLR